MVEGRIEEGVEEIELSQKSGRSPVDVLENL